MLEVMDVTERDIHTNLASKGHERLHHHQRIFFSFHRRLFLTDVLLFLSPLALSGLSSFLRTRFRRVCVCVEIVSEQGKVAALCGSVE
jgi:hypothetical protein